MPTVPASDAIGRPAGVDPSQLLWDETLGAGGYAGRELTRGAHLRLVDVSGDACTSMLLFNADRPIERLNVADTIKLQWQAYLGAGRMLLTDMGRVIASILSDTATTHDAFAGAANERVHQRKYGEGGNWGDHPSARDRLLLGCARFGLGRKDVHPCINWFKSVRIAADGSATPQLGPFAPEREVVLRFEMNVIVVVANCPHVLDDRPRYSVGPVRLTAWAGKPAAPDDSVRNASPENIRAFLNTEEYFRR